ELRTLVLSNLALYVFPPMMRVPPRKKGEKELKFLVAIEYQRFSLADILLVSTPYAFADGDEQDVAERLDDFVVHLKDRDAALLCLPVGVAAAAKGAGKVRSNLA